MPMTPDPSDPSNPSAGMYSNIAYGIDNNALQANDKSVFASIGDVVTKGIPLTGLSIVNSFANTGIELGNFLSKDEDKTTPWSIPAELGDGDYTDYYKQHATGIEAAGLLAGSLIPGGLAIKGVRAAEVGLTAYRAARTGELTNNIAQAAGLLPGVRKAEIMRDALQEITSGGVTGSMNSEMYKAVALGFADQALQGLAFQAATYATMKASPLLDNDSFGDVVDFMKDGALVGGLFGGLLEGVGTYFQINRALVNANRLEVDKLAQGVLGRGPYIGGDRALSITQTLFNAPEATTQLGKANAAGTSLAARNTLNGIFTGLTPNASDPELATSMTDLVVGMKDKAGMDREGVYDKLAGLQTLSRVDAPLPPNSGDNAIIYVNRFAPGALPGEPSITDIISNKPGSPQQTEWSFGYRIKDPTYAPRIANFEQDVTNADGTVKAPIFNTAKDAWEAGYDIAVINGKTYVNENAPNLVRVARPGESRILSRKEEIAYRQGGKLPEGSQPLLGGQVLPGASITDAVRTAPNTIINLADGTLSESAPDIISNYGNYKLTTDGITYGGVGGTEARTSLQSLSNPITEQTSTIEASARHVWAATRGIRPGDTIDTSDISMLEQLYREVTDGTKYPKGPETAFASLAKSGVSFAGDDSRELGTLDVASLKDMIKEEKDNVIKLDLANNKNNIEDIAAKANVPVSYIAGGMRDAGAVIQAAPTAAKYARLQFNIGSLEQQNGQILRGALDAQYRIQVIDQALKAAGAATLGENWQRYLATFKASDALISGAGPGFVSFARAAFGSAAEQVERIGKYVTDEMRARGKIANDLLTPHAMRIRANPELATELTAYHQALQSTGEKYIQMPAELQAKYFPEVTDGRTVRVLSGAINEDKKTGLQDWDSSYIPNGFLSGSETGTKGQYSYYTMSKQASDFLGDLRSLNDARIYKLNKLNGAAGLGKKLIAGTDYAPPIDTSKYPFIAYVREQPGMAGADGGIGVLTATSADDLARKAAAVQDSYQVVTKNDIASFHQAQNDYDASLNFSQSRVNSDLARRGILNDILPATNAESFLKKIVDWNSQQEAGVLRASVETVNAQLFAELRAMGAVQTRFQTSKSNLAATLLGTKSAAANPYESYIRTALALSNKEDYGFWAQTQDKVEAFADTAFRVARESFGAASRGVMPYEQASQLMEKFGLGNPYAAGTKSITEAAGNYYNVANKLPPGKYLTRFLSMANSIMGTLVIKLDPFQQILHVLSTPVMLAGETSSAIKDYLSVEIPGAAGKQMPATSKVMFDAITSWFLPSVRKADMAHALSINAIRSPENEYMFSQVLDNIHLPWGGQTLEGGIKKIEDVVHVAQKLSLSNYSETFTSYMAYKSAKILFGDKMGLSGQPLDDAILNFVNRVKGNIVASQRPVAFQGPIGQALGLFQTYQLNLFQNFFRYVGNGELKSIASLAGMQSTLFGYSSLPGFQFLNNSIVSTYSGNPSHNDLYGASSNFFDQKLAKWLLYGVASNTMNANYYTRGDVNPRSATLLPLNPLDFPAIRGAIHFAQDMYGVAAKIANGGSVPASILQGIEHNGLSRPLQGLAQLMQGYSTTSNGGIISRAWPSESDNNDLGFADLYHAGVFARLLGARPLDEAVALDATYRKTVATVAATAQVEKLGEAVKTKLYGNQFPNPAELDGFMSNYAAAGGNIKNFSKSMLRWTQEANSSVANQVFRALQRPGNQNMMQVMGGQQLPDYYNTPSTEAAPTPTTPLE